MPIITLTIVTNNYISGGRINILHMSTCTWAMCGISRLDIGGTFVLVNTFLCSWVIPCSKNTGTNHVHIDTQTMK